MRKVRLSESDECQILPEVRHGNPAEDSCNTESGLCSSPEQDADSNRQQEKGMADCPADLLGSVFYFAFHRAGFL